MKILHRKIYYWLLIRWMAFRWMFRANLGSRVEYRGKVYTVANGVVSGIWSLSDPDTGNRVDAKRAECKLVKSVSNLRRSYQSGVRFYMGYWYHIWVNKGIEPWMRGCKIWPGRR